MMVSGRIFPSHNVPADRKTTILCLGLLLIVACSVVFSYRGIFSDDCRKYYRFADIVYSEHRWPAEIDNESVASILHPVLMALAYPLVGHTLLASHIFPVLFAILTPVLFFFLAKRIFRSALWAFLGTVAYIVYPTNLIFLNQNLTEPGFVFWVVATMLALEYSKERPALLLLVGGTSALMVLTRWFDGLMFAAFAGMAICVRGAVNPSPPKRKNDQLMKWGSGGILVFAGVLLLSSLLLQYSLEHYWTYFQYMSTARNAYYAQEVPAVVRTVAAVKSYLRWFFGGKLVPLFSLVFLAGVAHNWRNRVFYPLLCFTGYTLFLFAVLGGRQIEPYLMRLAVKVIPGLVIVLMSGMKWGYEMFRTKSAGTRRIGVVGVVGLIWILMFGITPVRVNQRFMTLMQDIVPSAPLWTIIRHNPTLPTYGEGGIPHSFREEIYKTVLGGYRPAYRSKLAEHAWEAELPQEAREDADFSFATSFTEREQWDEFVVQREGTSSLWTAQHPGFLGAFPVEADGTVILKFSFPKKVQHIVFSDIHTQWGPGDIVRMWTSPDGVDWTLQYDDNLRYQTSYYHQTFAEELADGRDFYVKYYFYAGDATRASDDNRGAALHEFSLAATFYTE